MLGPKLYPGVGLPEHRMCTTGLNGEDESGSDHQDQIIRCSDATLRRGWWLMVEAVKVYGVETYRSSLCVTFCFPENSKLLQNNKPLKTNKQTEL